MLPELAALEKILDLGAPHLQVDVVQQVAVASGPQLPIYAALVNNITVTDDISYSIWTCMGYTVLLCFTLFKTGSLAKSVFNAH